MKRIVNVSGGMASGECLFRVKEAFPGEEIFAGFADTLCESADTYRFLDDLERVSGIPIARLSDGRNCWDVWISSLMFTTGLNNGCKASWELKKKPLEGWRTSFAAPQDAVIYIGFGPDEHGRQLRIRESKPWSYDFPLMWKPWLKRCDLADGLRKRGIEPPAIYADGYKHNNCSGACILAGIGQWTGLLHDNPTLFAEYEEKEQRFLAGLRERENRNHDFEGSAGRGCQKYVAP